MCVCVCMYVCMYVCTCIHIHSYRFLEHVCLFDAPLEEMQTVISLGQATSIFDAQNSYDNSMGAPAMHVRAHHGRHSTSNQPTLERDCPNENCSDTVKSINHSRNLFDRHMGYIDYNTNRKPAKDSRAPCFS